MEQLAAGGAAAREALACLFRSYQALFVKRLGFLGLPEAEAEEVAQDLWMEVARASPRYERGAPVRFFLKGFLINAQRRYFSDRKKKPPMDSLPDEDLVTPGEVSMAFAEQPASSDPAWLDFVRCVRSAFAAFEVEHPRLASLLLLRHVEECSLEEIAVQVGGTPTQAKADVHSARGKFKPKVADCLELWPDRQRGRDDAPRP